MSLIPLGFGEKGVYASYTRAVDAWGGRSMEQRAVLLERIADAIETHTGELIALLIREAGKNRLDGVLEVREAVDFCRYYANQARQRLAGEEHVGLGPVVCISPWNFPLAIFTGQIVAALVAGNTVLAKPAEQTPLIATRTVQLMHQAGVPAEVLALLPGDGATVGGALVGDPRCAAVCFTGSLDTATLIDRMMVTRGNPRAPLLGATGTVRAAGYRRYAATDVGRCDA